MACAKICDEHLANLDVVQDIVTFTTFVVLPKARYETFIYYCFTKDYEQGLNPSWIQKTLVSEGKTHIFIKNFLVSQFTI